MNAEAGPGAGRAGPAPMARPGGAPVRLISFTGTATAPTVTSAAPLRRAVKLLISHQEEEEP
jgi:hypothetical protein